MLMREKVPSDFCASKNLLKKEGDQKKKRRNGRENSNDCVRRKSELSEFVE